MCTADNGVGNPVSEEVLLTVLCEYTFVVYDSIAVNTIRAIGHSISSLKIDF